MGRHLSFAVFGALLVVSLVMLGCGARHEIQPTDQVADAVTADSLLALTNNGCKVVSQHSYALDNGTQVNICSLNGAIYWKADMDIDCDGKRTTQCNETTDCCFQPDTAFHNLADQPLTASITPYIVIPNDFTFPGLDTTNGGNVTAVIFNGKLQYAVFGDTGPTNIIGEASYACAQKLGINPDPSNGGVGGAVVTYITFVGSGTRPSDIENQTETATLGDKLATQLIANNGGSCTPTTCSAQGKNCGAISDGCGGTLNCGTCSTGQVCSSANQCVTGSGWSSQDVGSVSPAGTFSQSSNSFTVKGSGADIWSSTDAFRYVYQTLTGDGSITARVASVQNVNVWTKGGVMMRDTLTAGAKNVYMLASPTASNNYRWQVRSSAGGSTTSTVPPSTACGNGTAPVWVKITRSGSTFTGFCSADGSSWTQVGSASVSMSSTIEVGLAVTSHLNGTLATGTFDNVSISSGTTCTPTTCSALGKNCGSVADGCGGTLSCGTCTSPQTCGGGGVANVCGTTTTSSCSFTITQNVYDGPNWWGTITFKNNGPSNASHFSLTFNVPSGAHCTNDAVPAGAVLSPLTGTGSSATTTSNTCTYTWSGTTLASGSSLTMNYSTDSQNFSAATNVVVHDSVCAP
jgi:hypothetical protein